MNRDKLLDSIKKITSNQIWQWKKIPIEIEILHWMINHSSKEETKEMISQKKFWTSSSSVLGYRTQYHGIPFEKQISRNACK